MIKTALLFLFGLMCLQTVKAQTADSIVLYITHQNKIVSTKDSADYFLMIMLPPDSSTGVKINLIKEFYLNKQPKLIGNTVLHINGKQLYTSFDGPCIEYFPNGHKKSMTIYKNGIPNGYSRNYYPNGRLYSLSLYDNKNKLIECRDSTGNVLAQNGAGKWVKFDVDFKHKFEEGMIKDSLEDGEWQKFVNDSAKYVLTYKNGIAISYTDPNWITQIFAAVEVEPRFKTGAAGFNAYLAKAVKFPEVDRENGTQGKVIVTFVVEKDGSLSDVKALRGPDKSMMDAAVEAIEQSPPWVPGMQGGRPVRVQFTISFAFSVATHNF